MDRKAPMMLRIGNKGDSLVEQMVAVAVLSLAVVLIYGAFFSCLNAFNYSLDRLSVQRWMDEKVWEMQEELNCSETLVRGEQRGSFIDKNKNFAWETSVKLIGEAQDAYLYRSTLNVFWKQAQRNISVSQIAYVSNWQKN